MKKPNKHKKNRKRENIEILLLVVGAISSFLVSWDISVSGVIPPSIASVIIESLINVNAALLGFWGIVLVFLFTSYSTYVMEVRSEHQKAAMERDRIQIEELKTKKENGNEAIFSSIIKSYEKHAKALEHLLKDLDEWHHYVRKQGVVVAFFFIASMVSSTYAIGKITAQGLNFLFLFFPLSFFLWGTELFFSELTNYRSSKK